MCRDDHRCIVETDRRLLVEIARRIDNHELRPYWRTFDLEDGARAFLVRPAGRFAR